MKTNIASLFLLFMIGFFVGVSNPDLVAIEITINTEMCLMESDEEIIQLEICEEIHSCVKYNELANSGQYEFIATTPFIDDT